MRQIIAIKIIKKIRINIQIAKNCFRINYNNTPMMKILQKINLKIKKLVKIKFSNLIISNILYFLLNSINY